MTPATKELVLNALRSYLGPEHIRAQLMFARYTPEQMQEPHGESGHTRQEILQGYLDQETAVMAAIREVEAL